MLDDGVDAERLNRSDWDAEADAYQAAHGEFLRDVGFVWSPEGLDEEHAQSGKDPSARCGHEACRPG